MPHSARTPHELALVFNDVHRCGTAALRAGDLKGVSDAIAVERSLILEQHEDIVEQRARFERQRASLEDTAPRIQRKVKRRRSRAKRR